MFVHCVYFWLRNDLSDRDLSTFTKGLADLSAIETVAHGYVGTPASTDRPIIDRTYSYALVLAFADNQAHDLYQEHPVHDRFRDSCSAFWTEVKIYDFETA